MLCNNISFVYLGPNQNKQWYIYRSSPPAEAGFSQRNVDAMSRGLAEADGPLRQTLDCLNLRGQRSGESPAGSDWEGNRLKESSPSSFSSSNWLGIICNEWDNREGSQKCQLLFFFTILEMFYGLITYNPIFNALKHNLWCKYKQHDRKLLLLWIGYHVFNTL